jgi:hypothetical protein
MKLWITMKKSKPVKYDAVNGVVNNPLTFYCIHYDSYGTTLQTDNIVMVLFRLT